MLFSRTLIIATLIGQALWAEEAQSPSSGLDPATRRWRLLDEGDKERIAAELREIAVITEPDLGLWQWRARAHAALGQKVEELAAWKRVAELDPADRAAFRAVIVGLLDLGATQRASDLAQTHWDWLPVETQQRITAGQVAAKIRGLEFPPPPGASSRAPAESAMARLDQALGKPWSELDWSSSFERNLAADRLVALSHTGRHQETERWAVTMEQAGMAIPGYAQAAIGNSLATLGKPGHSLPYLRESVRGDLFNVPAGMQLYYSLLAAGRFQEAERHLTEHIERQAYWKGDDFMGETVANAARIEADSARGVGLALARDPQGGLQHLSALTEIAPGSADLRVAVAEVELVRGRPRAAKEEAAHAWGMEPELVSADTAMLRARMQTGDWLGIPSDLDRLQTRFPYDIDVLIAERAWRVETAPYLEMELIHGRSSAVQSPGKDTLWRTSLRSPAIGKAQDLSVLIEQVAEWGTFPEGDANERRSGATFRKVMENHLVGLSTGAVDGGSLFGGLFWEWEPSDAWSFDVRAEMDSLRAPVRARRGGTTADFYTVGASRSFFEDGELNCSVSWLSFSDGNDQLEFLLDGRRRIWFAPGWELFAGGGIFASRSESIPDAFYFNPSAGLAPELSLTLRQQIRGDLTQEATLSGGTYFQEDFSTRGFGGVQYRVEWSVFQAGSLFTQLLWTSQPFDGVQERSREFQFGFTSYF